MPRPKLCFCPTIGFNPHVTYFKPRGVSMVNLEIVELTIEELEALRLKNALGLNQTKCAKKMHTSQSTFQRILVSAYHKVTDALVSGKAIQIIKHSSNADAS